MQEVRAQKLYNGAQPFGLLGFLDDHANRIIGYPILRQIRTARFSCEVEEPMDMVIKECTGTRGISIEDTRNFCANWQSNGTFPGACNHPEFRYESSTALQTLTQLGRLGTYGGGGYVIRLTGTQDDVLARMRELQKMQWVDKRTRAIILEFSVYNANVNLFSTCTVYMEINEGGGIQPKWRFEPVKLIKITNNLNDYISYIFELLFVVAIAFFTLRELWAIKLQKCNYFYQYWNWAEIILLLMSYIEIAIYFYKLLLTNDALAEFKRTKGNAYLRMDYAVMYDQYYVYLLGFIMFVCVLKLIKLLQFNKRMNVLALTIGLCWDELSYFFIAFCVIFFAFSTLFYFIFFTHLRDFSGISRAVQTSFKMMLGKFEFDEMRQANELSPLLFFVFSVLNSMVLINIMMSIILSAFKTVQDDLLKKENKYDLMDYVWSTFRKSIALQPNSVTQIKIDKSEKNIKAVAGNEEDHEELPDKVG